MAILVADNFNRTDANPIGGNWATITSLGAIRLVSNAIATASGVDGDSGARNTAITWPDDQFSRFTVSAAPGALDGGPAVRCASGAETLYFATWQSGAAQLWKVVAGAFTELSPGGGGGAAVAGDVLEVRAIGTTISARLNGTQVKSATDAGITSGSAGVFMFDGGLRLDNFEGGDFMQFQPGDWPNPRTTRRSYDALTWTSNDLTSRLPAGAVQSPFFLTDWPNPRGKAYPQSLREFSSYYVIDDSVPFVQTQWENPRGKRYPSSLREWAQSLTTTTLAPVGAPPFKLTDWPNPLSLGRGRDARSSALNLLQSTLAPILASPFFLTDWPNPQRPRIDQRGFTDASEFWMLSDSQFAGPGQFKGYDWPNPQPLDRGRDARTFTFNLLESTLAPVPGVPFTPIDWPNPLTLGRGRDARTFTVNLQETTLAPLVVVPFYLTDWPNPQIKAPSYLRTFIGNPLTLNQVGGAKPFFFKDWVNPRGYAYPLSLRAWLGNIALTINQTGGLVLPESTIVLVSSTHLRGLVSSTHPRDVTGPTHPRTLET